MRKATKGILTVVSSLFFISGCVTTGDFEQLKADVARLNLENSNLRGEIAQLRTRVDKLSADLANAAALKEGQLTLIGQTQDYAKELQLLKGRFEENSYQNERKFKELQEKIAELQSKLAQPQPAQPTQPKEPEQKKVTQEFQKSPKELYDLAHLDIKDKKFSAAREKFQEIVNKHPNFELLPNAYFWIGETYFNEKKYEDAILAYEEFLKKYPKHEKAPGALLKEGLAFMELKDRRTAKVVFEKVIERYPKSKEAEIAQKKIAEILRSNTAPSKTKQRR